MNTNKNFQYKPNGVALIMAIFALVGIVVSGLLIKEDVLSTAHTIFEFFPSMYNVSPASTWEGAVYLGIFTSVLQAIALSITMSKEFSKSVRWLAGFLYVLSMPFDNWTDVVHRSAWLTGNVKVAIASTIAFYTAGSEMLQGMAWLVLIKNWRRAISDLMFGALSFYAGIKSIGAEWHRFASAADRKETKERFGGANDSTEGFKSPSFRPVEKGKGQPQFQKNKPSSSYAPKNQMPTKQSDFHNPFPMKPINPDEEFLKFMGEGK